MFYNLQDLRTSIFFLMELAMESMTHIFRQPRRFHYFEWAVSNL